MPLTEKEKRLKNLCKNITEKNVVSRFFMQQKIKEK